MAFSELFIAEEYYRDNVWKIYYRLSTTPFRQEELSYDGTRYWRETYPDEIKFSGVDAETRSHKMFELMLNEGFVIGAHTKWITINEFGNKALSKYARQTSVSVSG